MALKIDAHELSVLLSLAAEDMLKQMNCNKRSGRIHTGAFCSGAYHTLTYLKDLVNGHPEAFLNRLGSDEVRDAIMEKWRDQ